MIKSRNYFSEISSVLNQFLIRHDSLSFDKKYLWLKYELLEQTYNEGDGRLELQELKKIFAFVAKYQFLFSASIIPDQAWQNYISKIYKNAMSVVMIIPKELIQESGSQVIIKSLPLKERKIRSSDLCICDDLRYINQPSVHPCGTGFFIKENIIATTAHIFTNENNDLTNFRFIHGVVTCRNSSLHDQIIVHKSQVHQATISKIKNTDHQYANNSDWALVKVRPAFPNHPPLHDFNSPTPVILTDRDPKSVKRKLDKENVYSIGHGLGLSMKLSLNGEIIKVRREQNYFECSLTLLGGNSGSPVFYTDTHELAGIYMKSRRNWAVDENRACIRIKNDDSPFEGQECQMLQPIRQALQSKLFIFQNK